MHTHKHPRLETMLVSLIHMFRWCLPANPVVPPGQLMVEDFEMEGSEVVAHRNGEEHPAPSCMYWWWEEPNGNCLMTHCFGSDPNLLSNDRNGKQIYKLYKEVKNTCEPQEAGGKNSVGSDPVVEFLTVGVDPFQGKAAGERGKKRSVVTSRGLRTIRSYGSTLEEYHELMNDTAPAI